MRGLQVRSRQRRDETKSEQCQCNEQAEKFGHQWPIGYKMRNRNRDAKDQGEYRFSSNDEAGGEEIAAQRRTVKKSTAPVPTTAAPPKTLKSSKSFSRRPIIKSIPGNKTKNETAKMTSPEPL
jgi:hypothetical protein